MSDFHFSAQTGPSGRVESKDWEAYQKLEDEALRMARDHETYMHGGCHLMAVALHRITGLPIFAGIAQDWDIGRTSLVHAFVRWDEEFMLDVAGLETAACKLSEFPYGDEAEVVPMTEAQVLRIGGGRKAKFLFEAEAAAAMPAAEKVFDLAKRQAAIGWEPS